jgi:hypothetical protein
MSFDIAIDREKDDVRRAVMQFAARRGYHLSQPWYMEGWRIEMTPQAGPPTIPLDQQDTLSGMLDAATSFFGDKPKNRTYVDVELSRKKGRTIVQMTPGKHPLSTQLVYTLEAYLADAGAYETKCPPICSRCTTPVLNVRANFCGRCGHRFLPAPAPTNEAMATTPSKETAPVVVERAAGRAAESVVTNELNESATVDEPAAEAVADDTLQTNDTDAAENDFAVEEAPPDLPVRTPRRQTAAKMRALAEEED